MTIMWMARARRLYLVRVLAVAAAFALGGLPVTSAAVPGAPQAPQGCRSGWTGLPYLNHSYTSDQGCTDNEVSGGESLTLGDTSGDLHVPAQLVLDSTHCDTASSLGRCVYYMTGDVTIPAGDSLTIAAGVTLLDENAGWCLNDADNDGPECDSNGNMAVNGRLILQPGATLLASRLH